MQRYGSLRHFRQHTLYPPPALTSSTAHARSFPHVQATGAGKSICYQAPAWATKKTVLVVSPLISLMQDQVHRLNRTLDDGCAVYLGSAQFDPHAESDVFQGKYVFVYVTPEKLASSGFISRCKTLYQAGKLLLMAVDEAHCISSWGHDFRKEFRLISDFRRAIPTCPIMALTATAVPRVRDDIIRTLSMKAPHVAQCSYARPFSFLVLLFFFCTLFIVSFVVLSRA